MPSGDSPPLKVPATDIKAFVFLDINQSDFSVFWKIDQEFTVFWATVLVDKKRGWLFPGAVAQGAGEP